MVKREGNKRGRKNSKKPSDNNSAGSYRKLHSVSYFCDLDQDINSRLQRSKNQPQRFKETATTGNRRSAEIHDYTSNKHHQNVLMNRTHDVSINKQSRRRQHYNKPYTTLTIKQRSGGIGGAEAVRAKVPIILFKIALFAMMFLMVGLIARQLVKLQVVDHENLRKEAAKQQFAMKEITPERGAILDSSGNKLAGTSTIYRIGITPKNVKSLDRSVTQADIVTKLATSLQLDGTKIQKILQDSATAPYVQLKAGVASKDAIVLRDWIAEHSVGGIRLDAEPNRYYNNSDLASQVIGYASRDGARLNGMLGLEASYDDVLSGRTGYTYAQRNNYLSQGLLPFANETKTTLNQGLSIKTTLNMDIQRILQREIRLAAIAYKISGNALGVVMNPQTGDVLAMAQYPFFESSDITKPPTDYGSAKWDFNATASQEYLNSKIFRNHSISDTYEPGSTFKGITTAIAFEQNLTKESDVYLDRPISVMGNTINCWLAGGHGEETFGEAFYRSCNPVFVKLSHKIGIPTYYDYVRGFGFMKPSGIDLPAETSGIFHENPSILDMSTLSFGESSVVTPLSLIRSYAALMNDGRLVKPRLVSALVDQDNKEVRQIAPDLGEQIVSATTSLRMRNLMRDVITKEFKSFGFEGYDMGGKTSTATDESTGLLTLSFCGGAPISKPDIISLIVLEKPLIPDLSSQITSRAVQRVLSSSMEALGKKRQVDDAGRKSLLRKIAMPNVVGKTYQEALAILLPKELTVGDNVKLLPNDKITVQLPAAGTLVPAGSALYIDKNDEITKQMCEVPDFRGLTMQQSIEKARQANMNVIYDSGEITGTCLGTAKGTPARVAMGTVIKLVFSAKE